MTRPYDVLGYTADADTYCEACVRDIYGDVDDEDTVDHEGNQIGVIFADSEWDEDVHCCVCGEFLKRGG